MCCLVACALQGLLEVLEACEKVRGQSPQLQERLEGCIAASVEAQFGRAAEEGYARVHVGECRGGGWGAVAELPNIAANAVYPLVPP